MTNLVTESGAWGLDVLGLQPLDVIPDALIMTCSTRAGTVEGDAPAVKIPLIRLDDDVHPVREGAEIPEANPDRDEATVITNKVAVLVKTSREQLAQPDALTVITHEIRRALTYRADFMFAAQPAPAVGESWPPAGLLARASAAGDIVDNLDALVDAVALIESTPGGQASHILAHPLAYSAIRKYKTATNSNVSLVGAGTEAGPKTLLDLPVITRAALPPDVVMVLDKSQVLSAYGDVLVNRSDHAAFSSDSVMLRATYRFGITLVDQDAVQVLQVPEPTP
ncbi:MAG: phage major capsid protein [Mycobacterium sp.]|nr:MAG: phage major capsid protein [Mycobacterium sp.]